MSRFLRNSHGTFNGRAIVFAALMSWLAATPDARAAIYSYVDDNGTTHMVNSLDKVPEKYRDKMGATQSAKPPPPAPAPAPSAQVATAPEGSAVATVGPGKLTRKEYEFYQLKLANRIGKTVREFSPEERRKALDNAIEDELIFQAGVADGLLNDSYIKWMIVSTYRSQQTTAQIDPQTFTGSELLAYYKAHPDEFTRPASVLASGLKLDHRESAARHAEILRKAKANPESVSGWSNLGWIEKGKAAAALPLNVTDQLTTMKKGEVSNIIEDSASPKFICWVRDRQEPALMPFDQAQGKVRFAMIGEKQKQMTGQLVASASKGQPKQSEDDVLFQAGVKAGVHRDIQVRQRVIVTYLDKKKTAREQIIPQLKARFPVKILATE